MKLTGIMIVLAILAALVFSPFGATDVSELLPVQTLCLRTADGLCRMETDSGLMGQGKDVAAALEDLKRTAPGVVILSTTRQLVVEDAAAKYFVPLLRLDVLRPGTELYHAPLPIDACDASDYLSRHGVQSTVSRAQAAVLEGKNYPLPALLGGEGRYYIVDAK